MEEKAGYIPSADGNRIAWLQLLRDGTGDDLPGAPHSGGRAVPGIVFLCGFNSHMGGTKASYLKSYAEGRNLTYTRFDYRGHGRSGGRFGEFTVGDWIDDALAVLDGVASGPQILVGSSMGGWIALALAKARPERIAGMVLIAPAPDFPRKLLLPSLPEQAHRALAETGVWMRPSEFGSESYPITRRLIEESGAHEVLDGPPVAVNGPVRIMHGTEDEVVPASHVMKVMEAVSAPSVVLELVKGGDHRLSRPSDLDLLALQITRVVEGKA